jgi:tripartite-type tricarboxylate transporter receptor subunit TctC
MERMAAWSALLGPRGLSEDVVARWSEALASLARDSDWIAGNDRIGGIPAIRTPAETQKFLAEQYRLFEALVSRLGIRE